MGSQTASRLAERPVSSGQVSAAGGFGSRLRSLAATPFLIIIGACSALAALTALLPTVPSYDPFSWVTWGREVFDPHLSFVVNGGPSWKPLPVFFTAVWGLFGSAGPTLWVVTARAGGFLGVVAAYRLGALLAARLLGGRTVRPDGRLRPVGAEWFGAGQAPWAWCVPLAGVLAAAGVVLTQDWAYYMFRGTSEPMLIATCLWAVDRHLDRRLGSAFVLLVCASLIRPEAWPFILVYGIYVWVRRPSLRILVILGWLSIPVFWFVPPWVGSGQPFLAASHAKSYNGHLGANRLFTVLRRGWNLQIAPLFIAALVATAIGWRRRDRVVLGLAACAAVWWVVVVAMTLDGYPGLERFYLPAAGLICALGGAGMVAIAWFAGRAAAGRIRSAHRSAVVIAGVVAVVLVAISAALAGSRVSDAWGQRATAQAAVERINQLTAAAEAVGGHKGVFPCHRSFAAVNHGVQTALAWHLHVTLGRVGTSLRHQGLDFVGPHDTIDGGPAPIARSLTQKQLIAEVGVWKVYRVTAPGADTRCVGGA